MKKFFILIAVAFIMGPVVAQNCEGFYPLNKGAVIEMQTFNQKDKLLGSNRQTILDVESLPNGMALKVRSEQFDDKNKPVFDQELVMRCENNVFYMDMKKMLDPKTMSGFENMEVSVDAEDLEFPGIMQVGSTLNDANVVVGVSSSGMKIMNLEVKIFNRKVEAYESITTPAGTFDCFKISYDSEVKAGIKMTVKGVEWVAKNIGVVRSESYDKSGKLNSYTVISTLVR